MPAKRKVVAVIDDNLGILGAMSRLLSGFGDDTELYASAKKFLDAAITTEAICLIVDIELGENCGIEFAQHLAKAGFAMPIIFMTADDNESVKRRAMEIGCVAFLPKPFSADVLIEALVSISQNLLPNEQITYRARLHRIIYLFPTIMFVLGVLLALGGGSWIAGGALGVIGLVLLLPPWIKSSSSEFAITNKRVLIKVGLIRRHSLELLLQKVEGIGVDQGFLGRILGYGTITISGVGGTKEAFRMISNPLEFRRQVQASLSS